MRYTTLIDISEYASLYRSMSVRLVYLHLVCKSGYHSDNQDQVSVSVRSLASDVGLSVSATRHALALLSSAGLLSRLEDGTLLVKKFVQPVLAPARKGKAVIAPTESQQNTVADQKRKLEDELMKLRRWYHDADKRGDTESCQQIIKEANRVKKELNAL